MYLITERSIFALLKNTVLAIQFWQCTYRSLLSSLDIMNNNAAALYNQMLVLKKNLNPDEGLMWMQQKLCKNWFLKWLEMLPTFHHHIIVA